MRTSIAAISMIIAMILAGSSVVLAKLLEHVPPFLISEISFFFSFATLLPIVIKQGVDLKNLTRKISLPIIAQTISGAFMARIFINYGIRFTSPLEAGIVLSMIPAVVGIFSYFILKESVTKDKIIGILLVFSGILVVNIYGKSSSGNINLLGNVLIFGSVVGNALFTIIGRKLKSDINPVENTLLTSLFATILFTPFAIGEVVNNSNPVISMQDWSILLFYGAVVTGFAYLLWFKGLTVITASTAGAFTGIMPISSTILSVVFLGEVFHSYHLLSLMLVVAGIVVTSKSSKSRKAKTSSPKTI